jgi:O-antigen/teichoic acid export membrane protein
MIGRKALLAFGGNLVRHGLGYVGLFFVARLMGPEALGIIGFGFAYVGLITFVADLGFGAAHIKMVSEGRDRPACIGTFAAVRFGLTALASAAALGIVFLMKYGLGRPFETPAHETVIYLALATVALGSLSDVMRLTFAACRETAKQTVGELIEKGVEVGGKIVVALLGLGVVMLAGASVAGVLAGLAAFALLFRGRRIGRPNRAMWRAYWTFALPVMVVVSANAITENLDKLMVQFFWSSLELGYYEGAHRIAMLFMFVGTAVGTLLFPSVSAAHGSRDIAAIRRLTARAERYLGLLLFPVGALVVFLREPIVRLLLGPAFEPASGILALLSAALLVRLVTIPYATQILGVGRPGLSGRLSMLLMALNVTFNLVCVPTRIGPVRMLGLGSLGAALATLAAASVMAGVYKLQARRITGSRSDPTFPRILLAAVLMLCAMFGTAWGLERLGIWAEAAGALAGLVAYAGTLAVLRAVSLDDLLYLAEAVSPWRMMRYITDELRGRAGADTEDVP